MRELTPRQRVLLALSHQETDRVPVDFMATAETRRRLEAFLRIGDFPAILRHLGVDLRHPRQPWVGPPLNHHDDGSWTDEWGVTRRGVAHSGGTYDEIIRHPLGTLGSAVQLARHPWPLAEWWDSEALRDRIRALDREESYAIALEEFGDPGGIFEIAWYLRGMECLLLDMLERPDLAFALLGKVTDCLMARLERVMRSIGDRIDLIWTSDDVAHQHGPLISLPLWQELIAPHHERLNRRIHELGARVMYHSCGAVRPFIPGFIRTGVDVLDVLQFSADGMDAGEIKSSFGDCLSFHGGIDVQRLLPFAAAAEVRRHAGELIRIMGKGGGFILSPSHNIQVDSPPENIVAIYEAAGSIQSDSGRG